jgi:hypothetical protein
VVLVVFAAEGILGARLARDLKSERRELRAPFRVAFHDLRELLEAPALAVGENSSMVTSFAMPWAEPGAAALVSADFERRANHAAVKAAAPPMRNARLLPFMMSSTEGE